MTARPLWILATPRTGTTLLSKLLNQTGEFEPRITEWYNPKPYLGNLPWPAKKPPPRNGKVFPHQLRDRFGEATLEPVLAKWPDLRIVVVFRHDKAAQTASWIYSCQTNIWNTQMPDKIQDYRSAKVKVTRTQALNQLDWIVQGSSLVHQLSLHAKDHGVPTKLFEYRDIVEDPIGVTNATLRFCGAEERQADFFSLDKATKKLDHPGKDRLADDIRQWHKEMIQDARMQQSV